MVSEISATEAARTFAGLLDAVEHRHQAFTIVRRGKAVARLQPVSNCQGADVKRLLSRHIPDRRWVRDLTRVRAVLELRERP